MAQNKKTLLQIVQTCLNDMTGDSVNSINDTVESQQIVSIVQNLYLEFVQRIDRPWLRTLYQLEAPTDVMITRAKVPDGIADILWLKYNKKTAVADPDNFQLVTWKDPDEFLDLMYSRNSTATNIDVIVDPTTSARFLILNDRAPSYYTSFDDRKLVFDAYDSDLDSGIVTAKTLAYGHTEPTIPQQDADIPDLPSELFPEFVAKCVATTSGKLKQVQDPFAERTARNGETRSQYSQWLTRRTRTRHNYGRK